MNEFILKNNFLKAHFLDYGATLHKLWVKDKNNTNVNVIMGMPTPLGYLTDPWYRGAIVGRYAGRLEQHIPIAEKKCALENKKGIMLHSESSGWSKKKWTLVTQQTEELPEITFEINCPDGSSGFPGNVKARISYRLEENSIIIEYKATTDQPTPINLTNHAYFNLGNGCPIDDHQLQINATEYLALGSDLVPNGKLLPTAATAFDFQTLKSLGKTRLDDCFVRNNRSDHIANLYAPNTGIAMKTISDQPGVVVFTPPDFDAICFETQKFSNAPNIPSFPNTILYPGETYRQKTAYIFSVNEEE